MPRATTTDERSVDAYVTDLLRWRSATGQALVELDERVKLTATADTAADLRLAFAIWRAAGTRADEVAAARGGGRMSGDELDAVQHAVWASVDDGRGNPYAANLPEARSLVDALVRKVTAAVAARSQHITAVTAVLAPLTERVQRAAATAAALGELVRQVDAIAERLGALGPGTSAERVESEAAAIDAALSPIERDLLDLGQAKATLSADLAALPERVAAAATLEAEVRAAAARCVAKVADPPKLAVPDVSVLGDPPSSDELGAPDWRTGRARVDAFTAKLARVERALAVAHETYAAPVRRRDDLRGLLDGYRAMAASRGLGEAPRASAAYDAARAALYLAPCDLEAAARLVEDYQAIVRGAADPGVEDRR